MFSLLTVNNFPLNTNEIFGLGLTMHVVALLALHPFVPGQTSTVKEKIGGPPAEAVKPIQLPS